MSDIWPGFVRCVNCNRANPQYEIGFTMSDETGAAFSVCNSCLADHSGPGKFEAENGNDETLGTVLVLYSWMMDNSEDDFMNSEGYGYCGRFGQYLLFEDDRGEVSYEDCGSAERAEKRFSSLYDDGMGASEDDYYISDARSGYSVGNGYKTIKVWPNNNGEISFRRCVAAVRLEAAKSGYYPNLWYINDHGNMRRINY